MTARPIPSPPAVTPGRSRNMAAIRRTDTKPEKALRSALHAAGMRFRKDLRLDLGKVKPRPDIVFTRAKIAVFVDGCYWHSCPEHGTRPKANADYWTPKLARNVARDREQDAALAEDGWTVVRLWEHVPVPEAVRAVEVALRDAYSPPDA
ncbi:very short patch repair endonuclease [Nocardioides sp. SYSU DS0651]|uniref:very short patch repair endonuclease n=1 Tax=Nocardioides sp. SYSU DS0651 TaxID=3415955 RepID=UPI003F4BA881